jgi:hypothetical protein
MIRTSVQADSQRFSGAHRRRAGSLCSRLKLLRRSEKWRSGSSSSERRARPFRLARAVVGLRAIFRETKRPARKRFPREQNEPARSGAVSALLYSSL